MHWKEAVRKFPDFLAKKMLILRQLRAPFLSYLISGFRQCTPKHFRSFFFAKVYSAAVALVELEFRILLRIYKMPAFFTPTPVHVIYYDSCQLLKYCMMKNQNKCKMKFIINCSFCKTLLKT